MSKRKKRSPHGGIDEIYWDRLDNAAKLFPAITSTRSPNVFRFTAVLKEDVVPEALNFAAERALSIMPSFAVKLHRGLFWYYFDVNSEKPQVKKESAYPCAPIYRGREKGFLFRITYFGKRINFELYHALSDGVGATSFVRLLVYCYFNKLYGDEVPEEFIRREVLNATRDFNEDSFTVNMPENISFAEKEKKTDAYRINGYIYDDTRLGALTVITPFSKLRALAKNEDATISEFVAALLIFSIYNTSYRRTFGKLPIVISMPVNLRGMFDSATMRNFFGHMNISVKPVRKMTFDQVLSKVKDCFKNNLIKENFEKQIYNHVKIERIPGIRFVPLFIKDAVMRFIYSLSENSYTMTFSNLGQITLPDSISERVERFEVMMGGSRTHPKKLSLCSYKDTLALTFSSTVDDNSLEQFFVTFLTERGIDVSISSNETPPPEKAKPLSEKKPRKEKSPKEKKVKPQKDKKPPEIKKERSVGQRDK